MDASRHAEAAEYGSGRRAPYSRLGGTGEHEEVHRLLREATRLIERADLAGASEALRKTDEFASGPEIRPK